MRGIHLLIPALLIASANALASGAVAPAGDARDRLSLDYFKGYFRDARDIAASPARWNRKDWLEAGAFASAAAGLYFGADVPLRKMMLRNRAGAADDAADVGGYFGNGDYVLPALGAAYAAAAAASSPRLRRTALYGVESFALSGLAVTALKALAGRSRPYVDGSYDEWTGPGLSNDHFSFPSGHTQTAFSVATVVATEYADAPGVPELSYAAATLTALSRVYKDQHWSSDVFVGGALGYFTAKAVLRLHPDPGGSAMLIPFFDGRSAGLEIVWRR